ncbi:hypothetical protein OOT00_08335 [Desulfobotulus sp. H1]|uniref:Uncharacterized protein n=1 Tax=Desulfobotulus pelophilus TaxID=2823377 RepID=A0ABT3NAJ5_9BACT|nr:hypothetical protein [Desulfobotulus pelophilus]MCW7753992.1 hypothetical protein [Desulfobotulus pelophilus]
MGKTGEDAISPLDEQQKGDGHAETVKSEADHLYELLRPLHHLPRGKNTWNPELIHKSWFWPLSVAILMVLYYLYPLFWDVISKGP